MTTTCDEVLGELVAYHLGTAAEPDRGDSPRLVDRERVDAHLLGCTSCLRAYLRMKNHVERGSTASARPSEAVRRRIREDVAAIVRPRAGARVRALLRRPIPLYQGLAVAAVAAGLAIGLPSMVESFASKRPQPEARVDTSRPVAESLSVY
jgi:hypothetical protein